MKKLDTTVHVVTRGACAWQQALSGIDRIFSPAVGCSPIRYTDDLETVYATLDRMAEEIEGNFPQVEFTPDGFPVRISYQSRSGSSGLEWAGGKYAIWARPGSSTLRHDLILGDGICHVFAAEIGPDEDRAELLAL